MSILRVSETYNVHYLRMNEVRWEALGRVYEHLPGFWGVHSGIPYWFGIEPDDLDTEPNCQTSYLCASVEPSGLLVEGCLPPEDWVQWQEAFLLLTPAAVGFLVKPAEEDGEWPYS